VYNGPFQPNCAQQHTRQPQGTMHSYVCLGDSTTHHTHTHQPGIHMTAAPSQRHTQNSLHSTPANKQLCRSLLSSHTTVRSTGEDDTVAVPYTAGLVSVLGVLVPAMYM
jgi:hypothetical protein